MLLSTSSRFYSLLTVLLWTLAQIQPANARVPFCTIETFREFLFEEIPSEEHEIVTEDGFILVYHRIQARGTKIQSNKPVFLIMHGAGDASDGEIINGEDSVPYVMAERGFDVWLANARGNKFSSRHKTLDPKSSKYWDFDWQEMAELDLPVAFKYITEFTGQKKITFFTSSQGATQMFAALADPDIRPKIVPYLHSFYATAPIIYMVNFL